MHCFSLKTGYLIEGINFKDYPNVFENNPTNIKEAGFDYEIAPDWGIDEITETLKNHTDLHIFQYGNVVFKPSFTISNFTPKDCFLLEVPHKLFKADYDLHDKSYLLQTEGDCSIYLCYNGLTCFQHRSLHYYIINDNGKPVSVNKYDNKKARNAVNEARRASMYVLEF